MSTATPIAPSPASAYDTSTKGYYLLGLLNLELFSYTLSLAHAVNALVRDPSTLPPAMRTPYAAAPPQLYLDFTDRPGSLSREMSTACVRRDIEAYQQYLGSVLLLRQLDGYVGLVAPRWKRLSQPTPLDRSTFRGCSLPMKTID